jgi:hypothetical protein
MACSNTHPKCAIIPNFLWSVSARWWSIGARNTVDYHHDHSIGTSQSYLALPPLTLMTVATMMAARVYPVMTEMTNFQYGIWDCNWLQLANGSISTHVGGVTRAMGRTAQRGTTQDR